MVWGLLGFFGEGALYVNIEKKPGKNFVSNIVGHRPQLVLLGKNTQTTLVCLSQTSNFTEQVLCSGSKFVDAI